MQGTTFATACRTVLFNWVISIAPSEPGLPWIGLVRVIGIGLGLGEFLTGLAIDEPGVAGEPLVQALEQSRADPLGRHRLVRMRRSALATMCQIT